MRIGVITGEFPPMQGGVGDFSRQLAAALAALGHEVHVVTRVDCREAAPGSAHFTLHPVIPNWGWRGCSRLAGLARRLDLDVVNVQYQAAAYDMHPAINFFPALTLVRWRQSRRRPRLVATFHDLKVPYLFPKAGPLRERVVTLLARSADAAIVTNRGDELALAARGIRRLARIPIGSNIAPVPLPGFDRDSWRARLDVTPQDCLLGFFGFFNARKGVETLVQALAALDARYHLLFIGGIVGSSDATNRAYADRIVELVTRLSLAGRVHYTGYVPDEEVSAAFAAVDVCVLPYADGISLHHGTLMAALAHGQAIVSTRPSIELPELVHGENVWLVPPGDAATLAQAIQTLQAEPERRRHLARQAARLAAQFGWESIAARTAQLFGELGC